MKILVAIITAIVTGCVTPIRLSDSEKCALEGMRLSGASIAVGSNYEHIRHCDVPTTPQQQRNILLLQDEVQPKLDFNRNIDGKNVSLFFGFALFFIPGVYLSIQYQKEQEAAVAKSEELHRDIEANSLIYNSGVAPVTPAPPIAQPEATVPPTSETVPN